jgi:hypothetical protein
VLKVVQFGLLFFNQIPTQNEMLAQKLDFLFPFVVFCYGVLVVFVTEITPLVRQAESKGHLWTHTLRQHTALAWMCFWVGGLWSLQNLLFG